MTMPARARNLVAAAALCLLAGAAGAGPVTMTPAELTALRALVARSDEAKAQFAKLRKDAEAALDDRPNPVQRVVSEGRLESDPEKMRSTAALDDVAKAEALAWTWAVSGDERFAAKGREFILAWARINQPDGNPINETKFEPMIEAYDLLRPGFAPADRALVDAWLRGKAQALLKPAREPKENWQSHRLKVIGLIGATLGDATLWRVADDGFKAQIGDNFSADGASVDFKRRDALHYHLYAIQPLLTLACVAGRRGEALFGWRAANGASLESAVEFTRPYALGDKKHLEFANSQVKFDRSRAAAGEGDFKPHYWNPKASVRMLSEAGCSNPKYDQLAATVAGTPDKTMLNWRAVLNSASAAPAPR